MATCSSTRRLPYSDSLIVKITRRPATGSMMQAFISSLRTTMRKRREAVINLEKEEKKGCSEAKKVFGGNMFLIVIQFKFV